MFKNAKFPIILTCFLLAVMLWHGMVYGPPQRVEADALSEYREQQRQIENEIAALRQSLSGLKSELSEQQTALANADMKVQQCEDTLAALNRQMAAAQKELKIAEQEFSAAQTELARQLKGFQSRLRENYMNGDVGLLDVVFDATSMEDFLTRSYYMERILLYDSNMIDAINAQIDVIKEKRALQETKIANLDTLTAEQKTMLAELETARSEQKALVDAAQGDVNDVQAEINQWKKDSDEIAAAIRALQDPGGGVGTGIYAWPLRGYSTITSNYGWRTLRGQRNLHTGIDISAPNGTEIHAVDDGKVIVVKSLTYSYGKHVIIDHGNGISSVYAHMSRIGCSVGDTVKRGDVIGYVGSTGNSTGNHLHLEIRKNGSHVSPWNYVSKP